MDSHFVLRLHKIIGISCHLKAHQEHFLVLFLEN